MIRNLDYWQPASAAANTTAAGHTTTTNIVIVSSSNGGSTATNSAKNNATAAIAENVNKSHSSNHRNSNNNNEDGFDDKNGVAAGVVVDECRQSTVIVKMAHDKGERIEVTSDGLLEGEDDLIEEEEEAEEEEEMVIEEPEETQPATQTKALDASPASPAKSGKQQQQQQKTTTTPKSTPTTSANSSFEDAATTATQSPDHHARRPMNAFLIFCKKHRPIVREKYPNLENRAITKILGDWWANLDKKDQDPFKSLASNYKDAFLSANPSFKWYKLPAPPLRTLSTRPTNSDRSYGDLLTNGLGAGHKSTTTTSSASSSSLGAKHEEYEDRYGLEYASPVQQNKRRGGVKNNMLFKLAEVDQMGGLSNLMGGVVNDSNNNTTTSSATTAAAAQEDLIGEEDQGIEESSQAVELPFANMRNYAAQMQQTTKRKAADVHSDFQAMKRAKKRADILQAATVVVVESPVALEPKSSRACKGKKYQEFIKAGQNNNHKQSLPVAAPTPLVKSVGIVGPNSGNGTEAQSVIKRTEVKQERIVVQQVGFPHNGYCKPQPEEQERVTGRREVAVVKEQKEEEANSSVQLTEEATGAAVDNNGKLFDASDFELDSKIRDLPALSLDTYLARKRETKKKKKIGGKGKSHARKQVNQGNSNGPTIHEVKAAMQKVGSQKRKARKESITRRDVNSANTSLEGDQSGGGGGNASDLLILATLATGEMETPAGGGQQ